MKLNAILVEDEQISREILRNYITKYCPNVQLLGEAENIDEAYQLMLRKAADLGLKK